MRLLILATASTLVLTGTAMAYESVQTDVKGAGHHYRDANASVPCRNTNASVPEGFAPVDANAHDAYIKNLRDSGYNPACDRNANGKVIEANMYQLKRLWRPKMNTP